MKLGRSHINANDLSSDVAPIVLAYFLDLLHLSLKYAIQFLLVDTPHNLLQGLKKLIFVSHLNPFEFFFHSRKQVEVTGGQIKHIGWVGE
jgi:hypothetical protein